MVPASQPKPPAIGCPSAAEQLLDPLFWSERSRIFVPPASAAFKPQSENARGRTLTAELGAAQVAVPLAVTTVAAGSG